MEKRSDLGQAQDQAKMGAMMINPDLLEWVGDLLDLLELGLHSSTNFEPTINYPAVSQSQ